MWISRISFLVFLLYLEQLAIASFLFDFLSVFSQFLIQFRCPWTKSFYDVTLGCCMSHVAGQKNPLLFFCGRKINSKPGNSEFFCHSENKQKRPKNSVMSSFVVFNLVFGSFSRSFIRRNSTQFVSSTICFLMSSAASVTNPKFVNKNNLVWLGFKYISCTFQNMKPRKCELNFLYLVIAQDDFFIINFFK